MCTKFGNHQTLPFYQFKALFLAVVKDFVFPAQSIIQIVDSSFEDLSSIDLAHDYVNYTWLCGHKLLRVYLTI